MAYPTRFRAFIGISALLFLANLLIMNDLTTFWDGAETVMVSRALWQEKPLVLFPDIVLGALLSGTHLSGFLLRLPAAVGLLLSFLGFYWLGRPVYGRETVVYTLLVMGASFLIPLTGKLATGDAWLLGAHLLGYQSLILFLKQPVARWRWLFYGFLLLGAWIHPLSTLIFLPGVATIIFFLHPQGRRLVGLNPWLAALLIGLAFYLAGWLEPERGGFLLGFGAMPFGRFALVLVLGLLPFSGFWIAGLWDAFQKVRQGEELSQLVFAWLLFGIVAQSPAAEAALAFLAAKQLVLFFDSRYPHRDIVRTVSVLHLILIFFGITFLLLTGFMEFQGVGFRSAMAFGAVYWIFSFLSVIGMFGLTRRLVVGGTVLSGLAGFLLFWVQVYPLWEGERNLPRRLVERVEEERRKTEHPVWLALPPAVDPAKDNLLLYLRVAFPDLKLAAGGEELQSAWNQSGAGLFIVADSLAAANTLNVPTDTITGWNDQLVRESYLILIRD